MYSESFRLIVDGKQTSIEKAAELLRKAGHVVECEAPADEMSRRRLAHQLVGVIDNLSIGIYHVDADWVVTYVNDEALGILGVSREDLLSRNLYDVFPDLPGTVPDLMYRQVVDTQKALDFVSYCAPRDMWFEVNVFPTRNGLLTVFKDVTDLQHTNRLMRLQSEALNAAANAIVITDRDGIIQWFNSAFETSYGFEKEEVLGHNPGEIIRSYVHEEAFYENMWQTILRGDVWRDEIINRRKDGVLVFEEMTITPVMDDHGEITNFIAIKQDIGARKEAERLIKRQADLIELASDAIVVCDMNGAISFWNQRAQTGFEWGLADAMGASVRDVMSWDATEYEQAMDACAREGEWVGEVELASRTKERIRCLVRLTLVSGVAERSDAILGLYTDITAHHVLTRRFEQAQQMESIGTLAGGIAHDLNNLLSPVLMGVDILAAGETNASRLAVIESMQQSVKRSADLVQKISLVSRGADGMREYVDVRQFMADLDRYVQKLVPPSVHLSVQVQEEIWPVSGDSAQLRQAVLNLVKNSIDAMPNGGTLEIAVSRVDVDSQFAAAINQSVAGPFVRIRVRDDGEGMPQKDIDRVFDPFFTTKEFGKGSGLGLSTTLGIVGGHGGFLDIHSDQGHGTTVSLFVPALLDGDAGAGLMENEGSADLPTGNGELILVVDDEEGIRIVTEATLASAGYRVLAADDGSEAIGLFAVHRKEVALVITDLRMPNMGGKALIRALVSMRPDIPIIVWTGSGVSVTEQDVAGFRISSCIEKPVRASTLLKSIRNALQSAHPPQ